LTEPFSERFPSRAEFDEALRRWGVREPGYRVPEEYLPLNKDILSFICEYRRFCCDSFSQEYDRTLLSAPYAPNPEFLQIGFWADGSEVLVRKNSVDPNVYIADIEECTPDQPRIMASTIEAYLYAAQRNYEDSLVIEREWRRRRRKRKGKGNVADF